jgi:hypothetical protein
MTTSRMARTYERASDPHPCSSGVLLFRADGAEQCQDMHTACHQMRSGGADAAVWTRCSPSRSDRLTPPR